jgi:NAD(P)-dependent dehydrogenase (short-subunit alcohol dehydrogenase family)
VDIEGRVTIVTGAGSGIGCATALRLARMGAAVVVNDIVAKGGKETVRIIEDDGGRAAPLRGDVSREPDVKRTVAFAQERFGALEILVNNAGSYISPPFSPTPRSPAGLTSSMSICTVSCSARTMLSRRWTMAARSSMCPPEQAWGLGRTVHPSTPRPSQA